jgi:hypothetical protein
MKKIALSIALMFFSSVAWTAQPNRSLERQIETLLNLMLSDFQLYGHPAAQVQRIQVSPQIWCKTLSSRGRNLAFCSVEIKVTSGFFGNYFNYVRCTGLGYFLNRDNRPVERYNHQSFQQCMRKVYEARAD